MGWGKIVLIVQAVFTLILGILFFMSTFSSADISMNTNSSVAESAHSFSDMRERFEVSSYVLLVVAFLEIIIISRFV